LKVKKNGKVTPVREGRHRRVANLARCRRLRSVATRLRELRPNSLASLKDHYKDIDLLIPEELHANGGWRADRCGLRAYETVKVGPQERTDGCGKTSCIKDAQRPCGNSDDGHAEQLRRRGMAHEEMVEMLTNPSSRAI